MVAANASLQLHAIAAALKAAGERDVRLGMTRGLRSAAAPLIPMVQSAARAKLPKAGGLNEQVAGQRIRVSVRTGAATAGVRLVTSAPDTKQTDSGYVRHPVYNQRNAGGKRIFVRQNIPAAAGWWSKTLASGPATAYVRIALLRVMEEVAAKIRAA